MSPLLLSALFSFAPGLFAHLFGGDPQAKLRHQINALLAPGNVTKLTNQFYQQALGSPAYSQAQGTIAAGANQTANQVAANLGARGIGTTGTGAVLSGLTPSLVGSQQAGLRTTAYNAAGSQAHSTIEQQIAALMGTSGPSQGQQLFAGGLESFGPMLTAWLRAKYPGSFQFGQPTAAAVPQWGPPAIPGYPPAAPGYPR